MDYSSNLKTTPIAPHTVMHQKAKQIPSAIIKPNNRCFYVLTFKYMKLQFNAWWVMFICVIFRAKPKWGKKSVCFASQMEKQTLD